MQKAGVAYPLQQEYRKWLRYYLDFCSKYYLNPTDRETPQQFMQKLNEKGQSADKQKQACQSVKVYLDIRTIQKMLGHTDVRTTMIYTNTVRSRTVQEQKSPLDF